MLAEYDVIGSIAHVKMLQSVGLLSENDLTMILHGLKEIKTDIQNGNFTIEEGAEDIHSQVEASLTKKIGDAGKKNP